MENKINIACFKPGSKTAEVKDIWQWDYGQILRIQGLNLPTAVEIHFSLDEHGGEAVRRIGVTKDGVTDVQIPDSMIENESDYGDSYYFFAYIYLSDEESGNTEYKIRAKVSTRSKPEGFVSGGNDTFAEILKTVNEIAEDKVDIPVPAKVGQVIAVSEVDEDGMPTRFEATPIEESDPTVPEWAKQPEKPTYTAEEVGALPVGTKIPSKTSELMNDSGFLTEHQDLSGYATKDEIPKTASEVGADASGTAESKVSAHNVSDTAHNDIRLLVQGLAERLNTLADSDDTTLDQMSEVVAYVKSNKSLIDAITTSKVNVSDIIDNLTTNVSSKPLSAAQGAKLKALIDAIATVELDETLTDNTKAAPAGMVGELKGELNDYCVDSDFTLLKQNYLTSAYNGFYVNKNGDFGFNNVDNITSEMFVTAFLPPLKELCFTITSGENWFILGGKNKNYVCKEITGHNQNLAEFVNSSNEFNVLGQLTDYPVLEAGTTIKIAVENGIYKFFKLENGVYTEYYSLNKAEYNSSVWTNDRFGFIASVYASGQFDGTPIFKNVNAKFPKADVLANSIIEQNKPYYSKKYHAIGDSITQGINATNAQYFTHFNDLCGFSVITTDGIGGSCLSSGDENSGVSRLVNIPSDSDIVSIFMGTNDFGHHHMLGNMHDSTPSDTSTFYGALKYTCEYMNTNFNNKWFFITPIQRNYKYAPALNMNSGVETNRNGNTLEDFVNAIIKVCNHYSVPYIDLYHNCFDGHSEKVHELYLTDGLHPNPNGHIIMARKIAKFINNYFLVIN